MESAVQPWHRVPRAVMSSFLEGFSQTHRGGTWGHRLVVALTVLGQLDSVVLEGFSNQHNSMASCNKGLDTGINTGP